MRETLKIGWASESITPDRPVMLEGQLYPRVSKYVHDPVTATALAISSGERHCVMVSLDMVFISEALAARIRAAVGGAAGLDADAITFSCIHTHNSTSFSHDAFRERFRATLGDGVPPLPLPDDLLGGEEATRFAVGRIAGAILRAWEGRAPGGVSCAQEYAAVGFNRRPVFRRANGNADSVMYGGCDDPNFVRFEGTVDHGVNALYTWDVAGNLTGVAVGVPCPAQVMELHSFISADFWGHARAHIREKLGNVFVLPLCEASGDQNPLDLVRISKSNREELAKWNAQAGEVWLNLDLDRECDRIGRRIASAVEIALPAARAAIEYLPAFKFLRSEVELPIRTVDAADAIEAKRAIEEAQARYTREHPATSEDIVEIFEPLGVHDRWKLQRQTQSFRYRAAFLRLGNAVLSFNPFELFVDYALRVRARAKAEHVFVVQLTDGYAGYLPTKEAVEGGSYSSKPASTLIGPEGGEKLVEIYLEQINAL